MPGTRIRTTYPVKCEMGFILPSTDGKVVIPVYKDAYLCEFEDVEIRTVNGVEEVSVVATVPGDCLSEIPKPLR